MSYRTMFRRGRPAQWACVLVTATVLSAGSLAGCTTSSTRLTSASTSATSTPCAPVLDSVTTIKASKTQSITLAGHCLDEPPSKSSTGRHLVVVVDSQGWAASSTGTALLVDVRSWANDRVVLSGFSGAYGHGTGDHELQPGDDLAFEVWGPASTPAIYHTKVAVDVETTSTVTKCARQVALKFNEGTSVLEEAYSEIPPPPVVLTVVLDGTSVIQSPLKKSILTKSMVTNLSSCAAQPDAALAFVDGLDTSSVDVLAAMIGGGVKTTLLDKLAVSAYDTNAVTAHLSGTLFTYGRDVSSIFTSTGTERGLLHDLVPHAAATIDFLSGLTGSEIQTWSQDDQGLFGSDGVFEQMSDAALKTSWPGYADYALYAGPLDPSQLGGLMYGATRDNAGRKNATATMTSWFLAHSSPPSTASPADVVDWLAPLANMNMAIAAPTAAFLDSVVNWISAGETVAESALFVGADIVSSGLLTPYLAALRVGTVADEALATAAEGASTFYHLLEGISEAAEEAELEEDADTVGARAWSAIETKQDISDDVKNLKVSPGQKAALAYDLAIEHNTCVEAVVRLLQEHDLYVWQSTKAEKLQNSPSIPVAEAILKDSPDIFVGKSHIPVAVLLAAVEAQFGMKVRFGTG